MAKLTMTAQFCKQDALSGPDDPTSGLPGTSLRGTTVASRKTSHERMARFARRPLVMSFLTSLQCHVDLCQVSPTLG